MEKVLLAIDGITPDKKAFNYAVELCTRIKADLNVLHIVRSQNMNGLLEKAINRAKCAKLFFEGTMMATTFAEAGEHATADNLMNQALININKLLPESEKAGISCHLTMKSGNPNEEIVRFVRDHKDVVVAIYDPSDEKKQKTSDPRIKKLIRSITDAVPIPLVMVQNDS
jgi:nucleotide-binding universal stress UspA family protein